MKEHWAAAISALMFSAWMLLSNAAHTQTPGSRSSLSMQLAESFSSGTPQDTALLLAAYTGDTVQVTQLLRNGANVNAQQQNPHFNHGWTPVCFGVIQSNLAMVQLLLRHSADVRSCGLPVATVRNREIIDLLLEHGADPNEGRDQGSRNTPLLVAAANWWADPAAYTAIIGSLLQYGADPNVRNSAGETSLLQIRNSPFSLMPQGNPNAKKMANAPDYFPRVVKLLVEHGARVDDTQVYDNDDACCSWPDYRNGVPYCHILSPQGCNLSAQYAACEAGRLEHFDAGITPLMQAVQGNNEVLASALLEAGADVSRKDRQGRSVMDMATTEEMRSLLRRGPLPENRTLLSDSVRHESSPSAVKSSTSPPSAGRPSVPDRQPELERDVHRNEFICYRGPNQRPILKQSADSSFGSEKLLDVIINDSNQMMANDSQAILATEVTNALVIWRRMCIACATANAAVLRINGTVYIDPNLKSILDSVHYSSDYEAQRLPAAYTRGCSPTQPIKFALSDPTGRAKTNASPQASPDRSKATPGWPIDLSESFLSTRLGLRVPLFPYIKVGASDHSVTNLCAAPYAKLPAILKGARAAFDCPADAQLPHASRAYLKIKLVDGYTSCGPDENIVGCEANEFLLEVNAARYKFVEHGTERPLFGHGNVTVDLQVVLMHELGHWVGIQQHLATPRNIMSAYLSDAHCIDEAVVQALARMTEVPVTQTHGRALFYRRFDSHSRRSSGPPQNR